MALQRQQVAGKRSPWTPSKRLTHPWLFNDDESLVDAAYSRGSSTTRRRQRNGGPLSHYDRRPPLNADPRRAIDDTTVQQRNDASDRVTRWYKNTKGGRLRVTSWRKRESGASHCGIYVPRGTRMGLAPKTGRLRCEHTTQHSLRPSRSRAQALRTSIGSKHTTRYASKLRMTRLHTLGHKSLTQFTLK